MFYIQYYYFSLTNIRLTVNFNKSILIQSKIDINQHKSKIWHVGVNDENEIVVCYGNRVAKFVCKHNIIIDTLLTDDLNNEKDQVCRII